MTYRILWVLVVLVGLSACGGGEAAPSGDPQPDVSDAISATPTESIDDLLQAFEEAAAQGDPELESIFGFLDDDLEVEFAITELPIPTPRATTPGELPIPQPGTLVASQTQDPDVPRNFDRLTLVRSGGPLINNGQPEPPLIIEISRDGSVARGERRGRVQLDTIDTLNALINEMNFYGAQGTFLGTFTAEDEVYLYQITVSTAVMERTINAHEPLLPPELRRLIARIQLAGDVAQ